MRAAAWWMLAMLFGLSLASMPFLHFGIGHAEHAGGPSQTSHSH